MDLNNKSISVMAMPHGDESVRCCNSNKGIRSYRATAYLPRTLHNQNAPEHSAQPSHIAVHLHFADHGLIWVAHQPLHSAAATQGVSECSDRLQCNNTVTVTRVYAT